MTLFIGEKPQRTWAINSAARVPSSHGGSHWFESSIAQLNGSNPAETRGFFICCDSVRLKLITCRRTARRNARRFLEVGFADLQVMLASDGLRVSQPHTDDVRGEVFFQFGLT